MIVWARLYWSLKITWARNVVYVTEFTNLVIHAPRYLYRWWIQKWTINSFIIICFVFSLIQFLKLSWVFWDVSRYFRYHIRRVNCGLVELWLRSLVQCLHNAHINHFFKFYKVTAIMSGECKNCKRSRIALPGLYALLIVLSYIRHEFSNSGELTIITLLFLPSIAITLVAIIAFAFIKLSKS